jgi:hypothetical protein
MYLTFSADPSYSFCDREKQGVIVFSVDAKNPYYLDNIQFYQAEATITNPDDSIRFIYNPTSLNKTVRLNGHYVDVKNHKYANSITLAPFTSAVLIKNTATRNLRPTIAMTTSRNNNASFNGSSPIKIAAEATDRDGTISKVEFYSGSTLLATEFSPPYTYTWIGVRAGKYIINVTFGC